MTDTNLVRIPWHDGTTREVAEGTVCLLGSSPVFAATEGFTVVADGRHIADWRAPWVSKVYVEAPEPPLVVEVPSGLGAVVETSPGVVLVRHLDYWRGDFGVSRSDAFVEHVLRDGGRVLSEGIDPEQVA